MPKTTYKRKMGTQKITALVVRLCQCGHLYDIEMSQTKDMIYRNLVNFRATNFSISIVRCGYSSRFRFTHEILSPRKKRRTIITYLPGHVNAY